MLDKEEMKRYNRQIILPEIGLEGQQRLKQASVLVIGAGGLGCPVLQYLAAAGVGQIGIVDDDLVEESNLHRQVLYSSADAGRQKAVVAAEKITLLNPLVQVRAYPERLNSHNAEILLRYYDIVIDGSDNFPTRYLVNDTCMALDKPFVYGSVQKFHGQVAVFNYQNGPSYRCLYPEPPAASEIPNCAEAGVLGVLPGLVGMYMANEALKLICQIGEPLSGKLLVLDILQNDFRLLGIKRTSRANVKAAPDSAPEECSSTKTDINLPELEEGLAQQRFYLVDVRESYEFDDFNIGGNNIPLAELPEKIDELPQGKVIVFCCQSGARSSAAATMLRQQYPMLKVYNLKGGIYS
ncbi:HesA/MoeB/ThiF family protein [uncultured Pontibacter sp.]|uniref:HesA/MoeB/ThiF family protein n=1 Tax=uncultured Pontibacter sp. TaxID=453356 RepID=UPI0026209B35|nr:HesA/MoeB/ThiF family protein [uncultured Pontibacter sp.]